MTSKCTDTLGCNCTAVDAMTPGVTPSGTNSTDGAVNGSCPKLSQLTTGCHSDEKCYDHEISNEPLQICLETKKKAMTNDQTERIANALERIADALEKMSSDPDSAGRPKYQRPLSEFPTFDWGSIGAEVLKSDQYGAAIVSRRGKEYYRRSHDTYGADVWFARGNGKRQDGKTNYDWLIKFSPLEDKQVKPISRTAEAKLQPQPQPTISQKQYEDLQAKSRASGYTTAGFGRLLGKYGFSRGAQISQASYLQIWAEACDRSLAEKMNAIPESDMVRR
jgi:hypothetical protein